jgi:hypothetical protein
MTGVADAAADLEEAPAVLLGLGVALVGVLGFCLPTADFQLLTRSLAALATLDDSCWRSFPTARPTLDSWGQRKGGRGGHEAGDDDGDDGDDGVKKKEEKG